jgi:oxygen-dependent protoporphyrinogen oxidase
VAAFVRRKFGEDLLENLVGPFVSGIHAGDPEKLSVRSAFPFLHEWERQYGSVLKGAMKSRPPKGTPRPTLSSFREGVTALVRALGGALGESLHYGAQVESLRPAKVNGSPTYAIRLKRNDREETLTASAVVLATDTITAGRILNAVSPAFGTLLSRVEYAAVAVVGCGYRREQVGHSVSGFGFLVPRKEGLRVLGTVWCSSLFPGRAPEGMVNLTSFVGGATDSKLMESSEAELAAQAEREVARALNIAGDPVTRVVRFWPRALPQYNLGHSEIVAGLQQELGRHPALFLTGNYLAGASIGYCTEQAAKTAAAVQQFLASKKPR